MFTDAIGTLEYELAHLNVIQKRLAIEGTNEAKKRVADNIAQVEQAIAVLKREENKFQSVVANFATTAMDECAQWRRHRAVNATQGNTVGSTPTSFTI